LSSETSVRGLAGRLTQVLALSSILFILIIMSNPPDRLLVAEHSD